ncbi:MAG: uncharacterized DUF497 family protein [Candidatus Promineifilaceae bacterium]|jgi:uncharacterized DUF497 family protein
MNQFECDSNKSASNLEKHGIDFFTAQVLWHDPDLIEIQTKSDVEPRFLLVGRIRDKYWSAIVAYRNNKIRIISVRRARMSEVKLYES